MGGVNNEAPLGRNVRSVEAPRHPIRRLVFKSPCVRLDRLTDRALLSKSSSLFCRNTRRFSSSPLPPLLDMPELSLSRDLLRRSRLLKARTSSRFFRRRSRSRDWNRSAGVPERWKVDFRLVSVWCMIERCCALVRCCWGGAGAICWLLVGFAADALGFQLCIYHSSRLSLKQARTAPSERGEMM